MDILPQSPPAGDSPLPDCQSDTILAIAPTLAHEGAKNGCIAHPPAKRGVQPTKPAKNPPSKPEKVIFLDYLRGTLPPATFTEVTDLETGEAVTFAIPNIQELERMFGEMTPLEHNAAKGYTHSAMLSCGGTVHWHETDPRQRVLINLGGQALAELGQNPMELISKLDKMGFQVTRLDFAKDDHEKLLNLQEIKRKLEYGEIATRFKSFGVNTSGEIGKGCEGQGITIYLGDRSSEAFGRIYDKAVEQKVNDDWIRVEFEFKKRKAQELWSQLLIAYHSGQSVSDHILGVIYGLVDFKDVNETDSNKWRWPTSSWWSEFLSIGEKLKVTVQKAEKTLDRAKDWLYGQVGIVAAMVSELDPNWIIKSVDDGRGRMKERHKIRLDRWRGEFEKSEAREIAKFQKAVNTLDWSYSPG